MFARPVASAPSGRQVFRHVIVPGALPFIFTGLQISVGVAWFSLVAGEMVSGQYGLGYLINTSYTMVRYPDDGDRHDHARRRRLCDERRWCACSAIT